MKQKLCIVLGVAMFGMTALLVVVGNATNDSGVRIVGNDEAQMVTGGGVSGVSYTQDTCGNGVGACSAFNYVGTPGGTQMATNISTCGGSCGNVTVDYTDAPE